MTRLVESWRPVSDALAIARATPWSLSCSKVRWVNVTERRRGPWTSILSPGGISISQRDPRWASSWRIHWTVARCGTEESANFPGTWTGRGFNLIWRPHFPSADDHFLQLNLTFGDDRVQWGWADPYQTVVSMNLTLPYSRSGTSRQIHDANFPIPQGGGGLHVEPGFWLSIPATPETAGARSLVRAASIPHGTTILAQGTAVSQLPPVIPAVSTVPFQTGGGQQFPFPTESVLTNTSSFRTTPLPAGITQGLVDNPNVLLTDENQAAANQGFQIVESVEISVSASGVTAGGQAALGAIGNIPFLLPNADVADVSATFWLQRVKNPAGASFLQLQYSQSVMLNFNGLSWPHVTVGTLVKSV